MAHELPAYPQKLQESRVLGYLPLEEVGVGHDRHIQGPDPTRSAAILPWSHTIFSNLKAWLHGTFRGVSKQHMPRYLDEFVYRSSRRWRESEFFGFVLNRAVRGEPSPYSRLTAELFGRQKAVIIHSQVEEEARPVRTPWVQNQARPQARPSAQAEVELCFGAGFGYSESGTCASRPQPRRDARWKTTRKRSG